MSSTPIKVKRRVGKPKPRAVRAKLKINSRPARLYNSDMPYVKDKLKKYRFSNFNARKINIFVNELAKQGLKKRFKYRKPKTLKRRRLTKKEKEELAKGLLPSLDAQRPFGPSSQAMGSVHFPASDLKPISFADQKPIRSADEQNKVILYHAPRVIPTREEVEATQLARQLNEMQINKLRVENDLKAEELKQLPALSAAKIQKLLMPPVPDVVNVAANPVITANPVVNVPPQDNKMMEQLMERLAVIPLENKNVVPPMPAVQIPDAQMPEAKLPPPLPQRPRPAAIAPDMKADTRPLSDTAMNQILTINYGTGVARNIKQQELKIPYGEALEILKKNYSENQLRAANYLADKKNKDYTDMLKTIITTKDPTARNISKPSHTPNVHLHFGSGKRNGGTEAANKELYDDEIQKEMKKYRAFVGVIMRDELKKLLNRAYIEDWEKFGFIMNTQSTKEGNGEHWVAMYFDIYIKKFIAYFDPFGEPPHAEVEKDIKYYTDRMRLPYLLKYKVNSNKLQGVSSNLCGHHAINFLKAMFKGEGFAKATGWTERITTSQYEEKALKDEKEFRQKHGFVKDTPKKGGYVPYFDGGTFGYI